MIHRQELTEFELEHHLQEAFSLIAEMGRTTQSVNLTCNSQASLLLQLGTICMEHSLTSLAKECALAMRGISEPFDFKVIIMRELLLCQLNAQNLDHLGEAYGYIPEARLKIVQHLCGLLTFARTYRDPDLIQHIGIVIWNVSLPLLNPNTRIQLQKPLNAVSQALKEINRYIHT